ncbi:uncharacterized protein LAJ45_03096 [Morchella importuna]|uniref:uncharacterized protein n=1 Tax=Morchella importuna TaxID=1174673 RepID=UPI001E8D1B26|nr:uncharacterized protein LAJ45_03096 [Morchella importuna]KAH8152870.1 hypothetical protein LAJ45_03096 [Morchella importuna]
MWSSAIVLHFIEMALCSTFVEPSISDSLTGLARGAGPHWKTSIPLPELPAIIEQTSDGPGPRKLKRRGPKFHQVLCLSSWGGIEIKDISLGGSKVNKAQPVFGLSKDLVALSVV